MSSLPRERQRPPINPQAVPVVPPPELRAWESRKRGWGGKIASLVWEWVRENPGWLASGALHLVLAVVLSLLLLQAPRKQTPYGIEGSLADGGGGSGSLENVLDAFPSAEISSAPAPSTGAEAAALLSASSEQSAARTLNQMEGLGLGGSGGGSGGGTGSGSGDGFGAGFFGAKGEGRSFIFVVDMSGSMQGDRFRRATSELARSINKLRAEQSFYVFFFNDKTFPLFDPKPAQGLLAATPANKNRAVRWIRTRQPSSTTDPNLALLRALEMKPNVIFFLTDGELDDPSGVRSMIRAQNKSGVVIHTIAFENEDGAVTLEAIARENKGEFRFVK